MFGRRSDGKELKHVSPFFRVMPCIMKERDDSQVYFNQDLVLKKMEDYINNRAVENIKITILDIVFAGIIRILAERPKLNRFVINGRIYARNKITLAITIKKSLTDEGDETTVKVDFDGTENLFEVRDKLQALIVQNKDKTTVNGTDKIAGILSKIPTAVLKFTVGLLRFLDKRGCLLKSIIKISPFHTSAVITNVGSLGIDSIYHHIYNFGTTSMFFAIGKKKKSYIFEDEEIYKEKCINLAFVGDERICDGYYYASSFRSLVRYLTHPELLEKNIEAINMDPELWFNFTIIKIKSVEN